MDKTARKQRPMYSGLRAYFPDALMEVAYVSYIGNEQHNPGQPLHWDRSKSSDDLDAADRHLTDHAKGEIADSDGGRHLAKAAWRILAALQKEIEAEDDTIVTQVAQALRLAAQEQSEAMATEVARYEQRHGTGAVKSIYDTDRELRKPAPIEKGRIMGSDGRDHEW